MTSDPVTSDPGTSDDVVVAAHGIRVAVTRAGGAISSIAAHGVELLARTPWADEGLGGDDDAWRMPSSSAEWHRRYPGGWHLLTPAAGDPSPAATVEQPFHGEAAWRSWRVRAEGDAAIVAEVLLRTTPLRVIRTVTVSERRVAVDTVLRNASDGDQRVVWVEHPALAGTLFDDAEVTLGAPDGERVAVSMVSAPGSRFDDLAVPSGRLEIASRSAGVDLTMTWDAALLPRLYVWQERRGSEGFPWWGAVDAIGLEPASDPYGTSTLGSGSVTVPARGERRARLTWEIRPRA
ncbi:hypothetical protein [Microbacterium hydrocarbonoxydans]|uniref:hypothetical protein n=1 Tax=Microbacterium hydrocarbonoxydans TaxID=273678 RepID=UPI0020412A39|nr:hypothetical protein [Microbacterium hydrocarbonoxydans]MCM3779718.1 hypothetical protein [Microbacterium hydrocarbonoxydans]